MPRRVVAKVEWHQGELFPRVIVTNLSYPPKGIVRFYNGRGTAEHKYALNWTRLSCHKFVANQVRLWLFVLTYNLGNFMRRLVAGGYEALDSDQSSDQAVKWATGTPRKEAGVSACRGAGNQGNADRDTRTDQPASWHLASLRAQVFRTVMGSSGVNRPPRGRRLGRGRQF